MRIALAVALATGTLVALPVAAMPATPEGITLEHADGNVRAAKEELDRAKKALELEVNRAESRLDRAREVRNAVR